MWCLHIVQTQPVCRAEEVVRQNTDNFQVPMEEIVRAFSKRYFFMVCVFADLLIRLGH